MSRYGSWRAHTDATLHEPRGLRLAARGADATLIGVVGFSGSWSKNPRADARDATTTALRAWFEAERLERDGPVWCVSGATDLGVPSLAYAVADALGLCCVGVTAAAAMRYRLARLDHLVPVGAKFGDESRAFVDLCDALWMFGGGPQSEQEVRLASSMGKPVVVARGIGGRADRLTLNDVPTATFVEI